MFFLPRTRQLIFALVMLLPRARVTAYPGSGDPDADDEFGREDAEWDVYREVAKVCHALIMT